MTGTTGKKVLALSGGVGGAKLALGLSKVLAPEQLTIVANTGDDFEHLGLSICPDLDSVMYALSGVNDTVRGWGVSGESWQCLESLGRLGAETWFQLGDRDLATHLQRSFLLGQGLTLSEVTTALCSALGIAANVLPMSDQPVRTEVITDAGTLPFQTYFVREQCQPRVSSFHFSGVESAPPSPGFLAMLQDPALALVVICPSNPFVSVDPILSLPGVRAALEQSAAAVVAVSPIVGGRALKGPAAKMLQELGKDSSATAVAAHYAGLADAFVLDQSDATLIPGIRALGMDVLCLQTVMHSLEDKVGLAQALLDALLPNTVNAGLVV